MTINELKKLKRPKPLCFCIPMKDLMIVDKYGIYSTGFFEYKGKNIIVNIECDKWHLSVSANHTLGYYELKEIRYKFLPNNIEVAQIFPPRDQFVNLHKNCFHLWEIKGEE